MDEDLIDLLSALRGEDHEPRRREELLARLREDETFRASFVAEVRTLGMLKVVQGAEPRWLHLNEELGLGSGDQPGEEELEAAFLARLRDGRRRLPGHPAWWAAAVLLIGLTALFWSKGRQAAPVAASSAVLDGLAIINKIDGVRTEPDDGPFPAEGDVVNSRRLRLRSGVVTLTLFSGVTISVEGPAEMQLISMGRFFCRRGRLRARVPKGAEGFIVATPASTVVDLGTEFALNVDADGRSEVMVFEGIAQAALIDEFGTPRRTQLVFRNESFRLDSKSGQIEKSAATAADFITAPNLTMPSLHLDPAYPAEVLRSRPKSYWRFESLSGGLISNEVAGGPSLRVHGPIGVAHGSGGNGHAVFKPGAPGQFIDTAEMWELPRDPGHAVEFWVMPDGFNHSSIVGLYPARNLNPPDQSSRYLHYLLVELTSHNRLSSHKPGTVRFLHRWPIDLKVDDSLSSASLYLPRHWHHVVAQKNGGRLELYFDGELEDSRTLDPDHPTMKCHLVVGRRNPDSSDPGDSRSFLGRLDELAIYDHPLPAAEVRSHYRLGTVKVPAE